MASTLCEQTVFEWLDCHQDSAVKFVERYVQMHPPLLKRICIQHTPSNQKFQPLGHIEDSKLLHHALSSPNLPKNRKRKSNTELRQLNRQELFMELLTDVVSPDFDVNHLSHKILANILVLINGDRSSLFLVEGTDEQPVLVSRLFDVTEHTSVEDAIHDESEALKIPFGVGIIGHAAKTGVAINLEDAYKDSRFNSQIDVATGYKTKAILCMPIKTADGQVIGVAQVINKKGKCDVFSKQDEADFQMYLTFCAIGLINSQLLDQSFSLSRRLQVLLKLTKGLFEDTTRLEVVMKKVMQQSLELIPSERCAILLIDQDDNTEEVKFSRVFQVDHPAMMGQSLNSVKSQELKSITDLAIATQVAKSGEPIIATNEKLGGNSSSTSSLLDRDTNSVLCMPIFNKFGQTIGIAKLVNKFSGLPFNQLDRDTFEVFATFCGLGIHNVLMYEKISIAHTRHKVAVEVLSYHASASSQEADKFMDVPVPERDEYHLMSYAFDDLPLSDDHTVLASIRMFIDSGFITRFRMDTKTLYRWVLTVKKNYRPVTYHNWRHAFNVAQTMFAMYMEGDLQTELTDCEKLALLVACLCHDLDHRGTNNAFQTKSDSPLAKLYTTSTMEHHHLDHCIMILNSEGNQIFNGLSTRQYDEVMKVIGNAILSTDLALYFRKREEFISVVDNHAFEWNDLSHRDLLGGMLMTACDVAAITKPWPIQRRVAEMVANEFFEQGDQERERLHSEPAAMMDRRKKDELPKMQVGFINFICMPLYMELAKFSDYLKPLLDGVTNNRANWQHLADHPNSNWDDPVLQHSNGSKPPGKTVLITVTPVADTKPPSPESVPCDTVPIPEPKPELGDRVTTPSERPDSPTSETPASTSSETPASTSSEMPDSTSTTRSLKRVSTNRVTPVSVEPGSNGSTPHTHTDIQPVRDGQQQMPTLVLEAWRSRSEVAQQTQTGNGNERGTQASKQKGSKCVLC